MAQERQQHNYAYRQRRSRAFSALGINDIWNDIKVVIPDDLDGIDPVMFWAGGKLIALQQFSAPCAMIDTDFIVWEDPPFEDKIIAAHEEDLMPSVYPDVSSFRLKGKVLDEGLDYTTLPLNTAFCIFPMRISSSITHHAP